MQVVIGNIIGSILGIGLGVLFVIPLLVLIFGFGFVGVAKMIEMILG